MSDRVHYFSNGGQFAEWMGFACALCRHDPDYCDPMADIVARVPSDLVTLDPHDKSVTCHEFVDSTPTPTETLVEWAAVDREPAPRPPVVLPGQADLFGGAA